MLKTIVVLSAASFLALTACTTDVVGPASTAPPSAVSAPAFTFAPTTAPPVLDEVVGFGETIVWESGLEGSVSAPRDTKISQYHREAGMHAIELTVKLTNGSQEPVDMTMVMVSAMFNGAPADEVFDSANGYGGSPSTSVLPGKSATYKVALQVANGPGELQVELTPGFGTETAFFTGNL